MKKVKFFSLNVVVLLFVSSLLLASCSDEDETTESIPLLPLTIDLKDSIYANPVHKDSGKIGHQPLKVKDAELWCIQVPITNRDSLNFVPVTTLTTTNTEPLFIGSKTVIEDPLWNRGVGLFQTTSVVMNLSKYKNIKKITVSGLDYASPGVTVMAFYNKDQVAVQSRKTDIPPYSFSIVLDINEKPITQVYIVGYESLLEKIVVE